jgi:pantoate kinase
MEKEYISHVGGHITLFFTVEKEGRLLRNQGSRGVGINIKHGVKVKLAIKQGNTNIKDTTISVTDLKGDQLANSDILYRDLIDDLVYAKLLDGNTSFDITVSLELPTSQGFGMSAAGLIAVGLAFREYTKRGNLDQYYRICHRIERQHGSGLGDVLGIYAGGVEIRLQPGAPGASGTSLGFKCKQPVILVWQPEETRHTSKYINDENWQVKITKAGHKALNNIKNGPWNHSRWKEILDQSSNFCHESELIFETERKHLLDNVRKVVRSLDLQSHVSIPTLHVGDILCNPATEIRPYAFPG